MQIDQCQTNQIGFVSHRMNIMLSVGDAWTDVRLALMMHFNGEGKEQRVRDTLDPPNPLNRTLVGFWI